MTKTKNLEKKREEQLSRWGKLYSFRIPKKIEEVINPEMQTRSVLVESLLTGTNGTCPLCQKLWPEEKDQPMERVGVRISQDLHKHVHKFPSGYVRAWILVGLGYCPVCGQIQENEKK